jgi:hypothetical protein
MEQLELPGKEKKEAEKIVVRYGTLETGTSLSSPIGRIAEKEETYWRSTDNERVLLKLDSASYSMVLLDQIRTSYWSHHREDFFNLMKNVMDFP